MWGVNYVSPEVMEQLPVGMSLYAWMCEDSENLPKYIAEGRLPRPSSMLYGLGLGLVLTALRLLLNTVIFKPLAVKLLGLGPKEKNDHIPSLVAAMKNLYKVSRTPTAEEVHNFAKAAGVPVADARAYATSRKLAALREKQIYKFTEASWRFLTYTGLVLLGWQVVRGRDWLHDPYLTWGIWPQLMDVPLMRAYYHLSMATYWHFIFFQLLDTKRSDFWQMFVHHWATLLLLAFSWLLNLVRIGSLILLCHDCSDIFLELAKIFNYLQKRHHWCHILADGIFFLFATVFIYTRLYLYPRYMVINTALSPLPSPFCRVFFVGLLTTLLVLHIFWSHLILRMVYMFVFHGVEEDIRSDNGDDEEDKEEDKAEGGSWKGEGQTHHGTVPAKKVD